MDKICKKCGKPYKAELGKDGKPLRQQCALCTRKQNKIASKAAGIRGRW